MSSPRRTTSRAERRAAARRRTNVVGGILLATAFGGVLFLAYRVQQTSGSTPIPAAVSDGRKLGVASAPVQLDLWTDFQCPACQIFSMRIQPVLVKTYIDTSKARLTFHDMAFIGRESITAAVSARCADRQGKFWAYQELLFANRREANSGQLTSARFKEIATAVGLDVGAFAACLDDPAIEAAVNGETAQAYGRKVKETPTLLVNGKPVEPVNNWDAVSAAIDAALKEGRASTPP